MSCDVGEVMESLENENELWRRWSDGNLCSFSKLSVTSPMSQLILQPFRCFTYVTAHSPTLLSLLLRHTIFTYVTWRAAHAPCLFFLPPRDSLNTIVVQSDSMSYPTSITTQDSYKSTLLFRTLPVEHTKHYNIVGPTNGMLQEYHELGFMSLILKCCATKNIFY